MESAKWSRNLSANNRSEINRMRQITKQKMENKRNKNQQPMVTSTRQQSARSVKSAVHRKSELNDSSEDLTNSSSETASIDEKINKEKLLDQFKNNFDLTTKQSDEMNSETLAGKEMKKSSSSPKTEKSSPSSLNSDRKTTTPTTTVTSKRLSYASQTHSAEEDNLDESSEDEKISHSRGGARSTIINKKIEKSKSSFNLSELKSDKQQRTVTTLENNLSSNISTNLITEHNTAKDINPLKSLLNSSELLQFVINPVPRNKVYQCTIIRDKKGLDRSLYPTYYMHLQTINSKDDNQQIKVEDYKESNKKDETSSINVNTMAAANGNLKNNNNNQFDHESNDTNNRQVFLLSGRRRKKSKTYLISCNPFEITRSNSIAKLKSNVIGTQFNTMRILHNNQRIDYATIIYDTNVLGFKGPRKMTVLLPKIESTNYHKQLGLNNEITLIDLNKTDPKTVIKLKNKTPVWSEETQSYVLNFKGRVTQASVKNFQLEQCDLAEELENRTKEDLIENSSSYSNQTEQSSPSKSSSNKMKSTFMTNDFISMQFGRISNKQFTCDVSYPLSLLQAFSIALSSFDSKLACE